MHWISNWGQSRVLRCRWSHNLSNEWSRISAQCAPLPFWCHSPNHLCNDVLVIWNRWGQPNSIFICVEARGLISEKGKKRCRTFPPQTRFSITWNQPADRLQQSLQWQQSFYEATTRPSWTRWWDLQTSFVVTQSLSTITTLSCQRDQSSIAQPKRALDKPRQETAWLIGSL